MEVSVVSLPMNPLAQVAHAKSQLSAIGEYVPTSREFEQSLRDVGCSQRVAKRVLSKIYEGEERDVVTPEPEDSEGRDALGALKHLEELLIARQIEEALIKPKQEK